MKQRGEGSSVYEGSYSKRGKRHGRGVARFANGDRYDGDWVNGLRHGYGIYTYADGTAYEGEWVDDLAHGSGTCSYESKNAYVGAWVRGAVQGEGTMLYADGSEYEGEWSNGLCHGRGVYRFGDGTVTRGLWNEGVQVEEIPEASPSSTSSLGRPGHRAGDTTPHTAARGMLRQKLERPSALALPTARDVAASSTVEVELKPRKEQPVSPSAIFSAEEEHRSETLAAESAQVEARSQGYGGRGQNEANVPFGLTISSDFGEEAASAESSPAKQPQPANGQFAELLSSTVGADGARGLLDTSRASPLKVNEKQSKRARKQLENPLVETYSSANFNATTGQTPRAATNPLHTGQPTSTATAFKLSGDTYVTSIGPSYTAIFSIKSCLRYFFMYLFPYPFLPGCRWEPSTLNQEREYVVSGAALRMEFEKPGKTLFIAAIAVPFTILACVYATLSSAKITNETALSRIDMALPIVGCVCSAAVGAIYASFTRIPHALERLDRQHFPTVARFVGAAIDSCSATVYTWDADGYCKVKNSSIARRWAYLTVLLSLGVAAISPVVRLGRGNHMFASDNDSFQRYGAIFAAVAAFFSTTSLMYRLVKIIDLQHQVVSQLSVVSKAAYLLGRSILRPADHRELPFHLDAAMSPNSITEGFIGWYVARCFILYASPVSNHSARHATMSVYVLLLFMVYLIATGEFIWALSTSETNSLGASHFIGLYIVFFCGNFVVLHQYLCIRTANEMQKQRFIMHTCAVHLQTNGDATGADFVARTREVVEQYDDPPSYMGLKVTTLTMVVMTCLHFVTLACQVARIFLYYS